MLKKIYDNNEHWYPGINLWWKNWSVDRKLNVFTKSNYSRLINFAKVIANDNDIMINRHRIHMQEDFLMKKSFVFKKVDRFSMFYLERHPKYYAMPIHKRQPLLLAKIKPSLSSICNIPIIYDYSYLSWFIDD